MCESKFFHCGNGHSSRNQLLPVLNFANSMFMFHGAHARLAATPLMKTQSLPEYHGYFSMAPSGKLT